MTSSASTFRSDGYNNYPNDPQFRDGKVTKEVFFTKTVTSATSYAGDILVLAGPFNMTTRILDLVGVLPALTSVTSMDLGFYTFVNSVIQPVLSGGGNELVAAYDIHSGLTYQSLLSVLTPTLDRTKNVGDWLSLTSEQNVPGGVFLGMRFNEANTATSVLVDLKIVLEESNTH